LTGSSDQRYLRDRSGGAAPSGPEAPGQRRWPPAGWGSKTLGANIQRNFPIIGYCGLPSSATAVVMNVTVAEPTDAGDLRFSPAGQAVPLASTINWVTTDSAVTNGAIIPLAATAAATK